MVFHRPDITGQSTWAVTKNCKTGDVMADLLGMKYIVIYGAGMNLITTVAQWLKGVIIYLELTISGFLQYGHLSRQVGYCALVCSCRDTMLNEVMGEHLSLDVEQHIWKIVLGWIHKFRSSRRDTWISNIRRKIARGFALKESDIDIYTTHHFMGQNLFWPYFWGTLGNKRPLTSDYRVPFGCQGFDSQPTRLSMGKPSYDLMGRLRDMRMNFPDTLEVLTI